MCAHCEWVKGVAKTSFDDLVKSLPAQLEAIRLNSPNFYEILVRESGGDPLTLFKKGVTRAVILEWFKIMIQQTGADSRKVVELILRMIEEAQPSDHTWMTIQIDAAVIQHSGIDLSSGMVDETKH